MAYYNPFSLLFDGIADLNLHKVIPLPKVSTTPIETAKANISKTQLSKDTG